jgi:hypothetical protein
MAMYVCRKDGYDLTDAVARALAERGGDRAMIIEGGSEDVDSGETYLLRAAMDSPHVIPLRVICPHDDVVNVFYVVDQGGRDG